MVRRMGVPSSAFRRSLSVLLLLACAAGCRDEQAGPKKRPSTPPPAAPAASPAEGKVLDAAPADLTHRSGATWADGSVIYLGSKVAKPRVRPGESVLVAHYFRAVRPPPQGYQFFTHVVDPSNGQMLVNADHEIQNGALPLASWPVGKVVEDIHAVPIPRASVSQVRMVLGFWQGDVRLPVDDPAAQDGTNRMLGPTLELEDPNPLPEYRAKRAAKAPVLDGVLDDAAWAQAAVVQLVGSFDGRRPSLKTTARLAYDDANLYVAFDCEDPDVWGSLQKRDDPIYNEEVVEIFLDTNADGRTYNELQVSPNNVLFDAYFPARRQGMDLGWDSGMKTGVKVKGTVNQPGDRDEGWTVEMQIPLKGLAEVPHLPPRPRDRWRFNLYRLEHLERRDVEGQAFSPLFIGDFHHLPRFGWLVFE